MKKIYTAQLFFGTVSIVAGFFVSELVISFFYPQPDPYIFVYNNHGYIFNQPNFSAPFTFSGGILFPLPKLPYVVNVRTNSAGFRSNEEYSFQKDSARKRIMQLGDSIGFGYPSPLAETYVSLLEKAVGRAEIINASVVGSHTARMLDYYTKEGYRYNPDLVILQMTMSDKEPDYLISDFYGKHKFEINALTAKKGQTFVERHLAQDEAGNPELVLSDAHEKSEAAKLVDTELKAKSFLYHTFHSVRLLYATESAVERVFANLVQGTTEKTPDNPLRTMGVVSPLFAAPPLEPSFGKTLAYVQALNKKIQRDGAKLFIVIIPNRRGCFGKTSGEWNQFAQALKAEKIPYQNLFYDLCSPLFFPYEDSFLPREVHLTAKGNELVAERMTPRIKQLLFDK